jgi:hypothetical protein
VKTLRLVFGASRHVVNALRHHALRKQLNADSQAQIDKRFVSRYGRYGALGCCPRDLCRHIAANFKATRSNARSNHRKNASPRERADSGRNHLRDDTSPPCVNRSDVPTVRIRKQQGDAVGHSHPNRNTFRRLPSDDRIGLSTESIGCLDGAGAMHLLRLNDRSCRQQSQKLHVVRIAGGEPVNETFFGKKLGAQEHGREGIAKAQ